ncbi:MAG: hypothetical protein KDI56_06070 [Xanthomonadales bacterium]|nr:hypothetical protein [Xanthomonadales bacterium]
MVGMRSMSWLVICFLPAVAWGANGCLPTDFQDRRDQSLLIIANDNAGNPLQYRPRCARVSAGTTILFQAIPNFGMHPLFAGDVVGGTATFDPTSPIGSATTGTEHMVVLDEPGEYPYYCDFHFLQGMQGSILVDLSLFSDGFEDP